MHHHTVTSRQDETRRDETRQDDTTRDARQDETRRDKTSRPHTRQDKTRQDKTRQDKTRQDKMTRQDKTRQDKTRERRRGRERSEERRVHRFLQKHIHAQTNTLFKFGPYNQIHQMGPACCVFSVRLFVHDHGALQIQPDVDLRDSIFGSSRQMTIDHQKCAWKTSKERKENGWQTRSFQQVFFLSKSVRKVTRVQNIKKCGWCRGCQTVKYGEFFDFAVLRAWADSRLATSVADVLWETSLLTRIDLSIGIPDKKAALTTHVPPDMS